MRKDVSLRERTIGGTTTDLESLVLRLEAVKVVPADAVADDEARQQVVAAQEPDNAERKEGEADAVRQEVVVVDQVVQLGVLEPLACDAGSRWTWEKSQQAARGLSWSTGRSAHKPIRAPSMQLSKIW